MESDKKEHVGKIVKGIVKSLAPFGAFVKTDLGEEGLVHISEVANEYIKDLTSFLTVGEEVQVKVLAINKQGKFELSIKKAKTEYVEKKPAMFLHKKTEDVGFEDKLSYFLKRSEDKQVDIRRGMKRKHKLKRKKK